jgi:hypothetical protein
MDASNCDVAFTNWTHWHDIPWQDAYQVVGRLQARIAKAAKAGEWRNVKRLQRLRRERGLELSEKKTLITHLDDGFDFLGWTARWQGGMLLTKPSRKNVKNFLEKIRGTLRQMRTARQEDVIDKLNPVIRGWANYHRSQMATRTLAKTDHLIWQALWRWARRRQAPAKTSAVGARRHAWPV